MRLEVRCVCIMTMFSLPIAGCRTTPDVQDRPTGSAADAEFLRDMIVHHAQALAMVELIPARTSREELRLLGERIGVSQQDEMAMMRRWLRVRGHLPDSAEAHGHPGGTVPLMPGMLTREELARLAASNGSAFERLFLSLMIRHHEGALTMVERLFSTHGAAQDTEIYFFASSVEADQRAEIARMRGMLTRMSVNGGDQ